jgi:hypothetical protein
MSRMETLISEQRSEIHRLEDLVYRMMHRARVSQIMDLSITDAVKLRRQSVSSPTPTSPTNATSPTSPTRGGHDRKPSIGSWRRRSRSK